MKNSVKNIFYNVTKINIYRNVVSYLLHKGSKIYGYRVIWLDEYWVGDKLHIQFPSLNFEPGVDVICIDESFLN